MSFPATRYRTQSLDPIFRTQSLDSISRSYSLDPIYRSDSEKRQLFLRSYRFSRKQSLSERVRGSLTRAKRVICRRLRSVRRIRRLVVSRFRFGFYCRKRRFLRLLDNQNRSSSSSSSYCFC